MAIDLSIVVPTYNEQDRIGPTLEEYVQTYRGSHPGAFELIVVLNGCRDGTRGVVEAFAATAPEVLMLEFPDPLGKGRAVHEGLDAARGAFLAYVDADNMVRAPETAKLTAALADRDIAIGDRFRGQQTNGAKPLLRRLVSAGGRLWVRWVLGLPYSDTQCGAKALRAAAWKAVAPSIVERGWAFDLDVLAHASRLGLSVVEIPVRWQHVAEGSKVRSWRDAPAMLLAALRIRRRVRASRAP